MRISHSSSISLITKIKLCGMLLMAFTLFIFSMYYSEAFGHLNDTQKYWIQVGIPGIPYGLFILLYSKLDSFALSSDCIILREKDVRSKRYIEIRYDDVIDVYHDNNSLFLCLRNGDKFQILISYLDCRERKAGQQISWDRVVSLVQKKIDKNKTFGPIILNYRTDIDLINPLLRSMMNAFVVILFISLFFVMFRD